MKKMLGASLLLALVLSASSTAFAALRYGGLVTFKSVIENANMWAHGSSRAWENESVDGVGPRSARQNPQLDCEPLIGGDARTVNGPNLLLLVDPDNKFNDDEIKYGDKIKIVSLYVGFGYPAVSGFFPNGLVWWRNKASRWNRELTATQANGFSHHEIIISQPSRPQTSDGSEEFKLVSPSGKNGVVASGDTVQIVAANGPGSGIVWNEGSSYWGGPYKSVLINDWQSPSRANSAVGHFVVSRAERTAENGAVYDQILKAPAYTAEPVIPAGMEEETGDVESVSCGSLNGKPVVLAINESHTMLMRFDFNSMAENPWVVTQLKTAAGVAVSPDAVAVASDGTAIVLDTLGKVYMLKDIVAGTVEAVAVGAGNESLELDAIAVGNKDHIYAVDIESATLYRHNGSGWVAIEKGTVSDVAAGVDGTVVALNTSGKAYMLDAEESTATECAWEEMGDEHFEEIAVGSKEHIYAIEKETGTLHRWVNEDWDALENAAGVESAGIEEVAVNAAGYIVIVDEEDSYYDNGKPMGVSVKVETKAAAVPGQPAVAVVKATPAAAEAPTARAEAKKAGKVKAAKKAKAKGRGAKGKAKASKGKAKTNAAAAVKDAVAKGAKPAKAKGKAVKGRKAAAKANKKAHKKAEAKAGNKAAVAKAPKKEMKKSKKAVAKKAAAAKKPKAKNAKREAKNAKAGHKAPAMKGAASKDAAKKQAAGKKPAGKKAAAKI